MIDIPQFTTKAELFDYLRQNKHIHIAAKRAALKYADAVCSPIFDVNDSETVTKAQIAPDLLDKDTLKVSVVINTTKLMDSHGDVHIDGLWKKSLQENKNILFLQEHNMSFAAIISDKVKATTKQIKWDEMGYNFTGTTQALVFNAEIEKERSPFMFTQYSKGYVKNHSVGMRYVNMQLAMNSDSQYDAEEKATYDKYISQIANKETAEAQGYFWVVTEAKIIEGSAVPLGSNFATPTLTVESKAIEPTEVTQTEPPQGTQKTGWEIFKPI